MQDRTGEVERERRAGRGERVGGATSRIFLALGCDSPTGSSRKRPGGVGGGGAGARGDVRGGEARAGGGGGSVSWTRVEVGRSEVLGTVSPPGVFGEAVPASERVPANPRWRSPLLTASVGLIASSRARSVPPRPRPRGAFRWACSRPLPAAAPRRSSRDEFFRLLRDEPDYDA